MGKLLLYLIIRHQADRSGRSLTVRHQAVRSVHPLFSACLLARSRFIIAWFWWYSHFKWMNRNCNMWHIDTEGRFRAIITLAIKASGVANKRDIMKYIRTAESQASLRICAGWPGTVLFGPNVIRSSRAYVLGRLISLRAFVLYCPFLYNVDCSCILVNLF